MTGLGCRLGGGAGRVPATRFQGCSFPEQRPAPACPPRHPRPAPRPALPSASPSIRLSAWRISRGAWRSRGARRGQEGSRRGSQAGAAPESRLHGPTLRGEAHPSCLPTGGALQPRPPPAQKSSSASLARASRSARSLPSASCRPRSPCCRPSRLRTLSVRLESSFRPTTAGKPEEGVTPEPESPPHSAEAGSRPRASQTPLRSAGTAISAVLPPPTPHRRNARLPALHDPLPHPASPRRTELEVVLGQLGLPDLATEGRSRVRVQIRRESRLAEEPVDLQQGRRRRGGLEARPPFRPTWGGERKATVPPAGLSPRGRSPPRLAPPGSP